MKRVGRLVWVLRIEPGGDRERGLGRATWMTVEEVEGVVGLFGGKRG